MQLKNAEKIVKIAAITLSLYLVGFGIAMAFFPIKPFWNDEWRLIYNLKFKSTSGLWGTLDLLQECPRVYLTVLKKITSFFDYSYISLRVPALVICIVNIFFLFSLRKKIAAGNAVYSYLFVLIIISSQTFTDYIVQVKQYEMEIFASLVALWQLVTLLKLSEEGLKGNKGNYLLLCASCLIIPFFSYTYPIAVAPVFLLLMLYAATTRQNQLQAGGKIWLLLPLIIIAVSILVFYLVDVKRLMADKSMYQSYLRVLHNEKGEKRYLSDAWNLFALVGSGFVYEIVFGIVGIASFLYGIYRLVAMKKIVYSKETVLQLYSILLLVITVCLLASGKLIGGVARLTAYTVPSIAILIITFLNRLRIKKRYVLFTDMVAVILFLGLAGNIISTCLVNNFIYPEYNDRILTYRNTSRALKEARLHKIPLLYTRGVDGDKKNEDAPVPGKIMEHTITQEQITGMDVLCAEVILKVNPEYKVWDTIPVYYIPDAKWLNNYIQQLPPEYISAIAGDGINYQRITR